jgi:hypothetical protein
VANDSGNSGIFDLRNLCGLHHRGANRWRRSVSALNRGGQPRVVGGLRKPSSLEMFAFDERRRQRQRLTFAFMVVVIAAAVIVRWVG